MPLLVQIHYKVIIHLVLGASQIVCYDVKSNIFLSLLDNLRDLSSNLSLNNK
jgi:hypothetical protein